MYRVHCNATQIFPSKYAECTMMQQYFLNFMTARGIGFERGIDLKIKALCESMGVKFKEK